MGAAALLVTLARCALAGPPLLTDDPDTPGPGHWEINVAMTTTKESERWESETPLLDVNYGIGERIQLKYELPWVVVHENGQTANGLGNSLIGVKWRFLDQEKAWLEVSTYPQFEFNHPDSSVARGLADFGYSAILPLEFQHRFGPLVAFAETGFIWNQRRSNSWLCGIAAEYEINSRFSLFGELHGGDETHLAQDQPVFNLGFSWKFNSTVSLLGSAGRALHNSAGDSPNFLSYLALQFHS
jgi:hypothetical protein